MKAWAAALAGELATWPQGSVEGLHLVLREYIVTPRYFPCCGVHALLESSNSVALKLEFAGPRMVGWARRDSQIGYAEMQKSRWFTFA